MKKGHSHKHPLICPHCSGTGISAQSKHIIVDCLFCEGVGFIEGFPHPRHVLVAVNPILETHYGLN